MKDKAPTELIKEPSLEEKRRILKERAKELARGPGEKPAAEELVEVVEFLLARERYGVESFFVREIYPLRELTPVPCTPPFVRGIINVRGQILSVIDIKKFFDLPERGLTDLNKVIILRDAAMEFGILADSISGVRAIRADEIQPPLATLTGIRAQYLKGVAREGLVVLDAAKILAAKDLIVHEEPRG
ncbi:MAG TPA: chemotaxis protein CheW [Candidatus Acidoferrales bacterium]|nr:chemotaxis protein CheW [Candidatus Acidoferrales bacterium]